MTRQAEDTADWPDNPSLTVNGEDATMAALYAEFAEEDRELAEIGMSGYATGLEREEATL